MGIAGSRVGKSETVWSALSTLGRKVESDCDVLVDKKESPTTRCIADTIPQKNESGC